MISRVREYIERYGMIEPGDRVAAGISGGADSVCLLLALQALQAELSFSLTAVHVEHGLRGEESLEDAEFVERLCEGIGVPCRVFHVDMQAEARRRGISLEEAGRVLRYACFREACQEPAGEESFRGTDADGCPEGACQESAWKEGSRGTDADGCPEGACQESAKKSSCREPGRWKIAVAHHRDDQAETVLLNLFRGTGLRGLCGMAPVRGHVIRPLLEVDRREIEEWLCSQGARWRTDRTNLETEYTRNKLRLQVLPFVEREIQAGAGRHAAQAAGHLRQVQEYLDGQARRCYEGCATEVLGKAEEPLEETDIWEAMKLGGELEPGEELESGEGLEPGEELGPGKVEEPGKTQRIRQIRICLESFRQLEPLMRTMVLQLALERLGGGLRDVGAVHLEALEELSAKESGKELALPHGIWVRREYEYLIFERSGRKRVGKIAGGNGLRDEAGKAETTEEALGGKDAGLDRSGSRSLLEITEIPGTYAAGGLFWRFSLEDGKKYQKIPEKTYTKWFDYDRIIQCLSIRTRCPGDFLEINREHGRKKLKDYLIDSKVPRQERDRLLLLADGQHILWIPGRRISEGYKVTGQTRRLLRVEIFGGNTDGRENQGDDPRGGG